MQVLSLFCIRGFWRLKIRGFAFGCRLRSEGDRIKERGGAGARATSQFRFAF